MTAAPTAARSPGLTGNRRLGREQRLRRSAHFEEAYAQGRRYIGRHMVLWLREGPDSAGRLGVVSSRRIGGAVKRNRTRRRLRELFRLNRWRLSGMADVVIVARTGCAEAPWAELNAEFVALARRAGLLGDSAPKTK